MLEPFAESVNARFEIWIKNNNTLPSPLGTREHLERSRGAGGEGTSTDKPRFTSEQIAWLHLIRDHIATSLSVEPEDLDLSPFNQRGGLGKAHQLFGAQLPSLLDELNQVLAA